MFVPAQSSAALSTIPDRHGGAIDVAHHAESKHQEDDDGGHGRAPVYTRLMRTCLNSVQRPAWCACSSTWPSSRSWSWSYSSTVSPLIRTRQFLPSTRSCRRNHFSASMRG